MNSDNKLIDMPAGKENTTNCSVPFGAVSEGNGYLVFLSAMKHEVLATISSTSSNLGIDANCLRMKSMAEDIINLWPHSNPHVPIQQVLSTPVLPKKLRSPAEEGGRLAGKQVWLNAGLLEAINVQFLGKMGGRFLIIT